MCVCCKDCLHFKKRPSSKMGYCKNDINFHIGYESESDVSESVSKKGAIIEGDEGWGWVVGEEFGCVNFSQ